MDPNNGRPRSRPPGQRPSPFPLPSGLKRVREGCPPQGCEICCIRDMVTRVLSGLGIAGLFLASALLGVASVLGAHSQWLGMPPRMRRFVKPGLGFNVLPFRRRKR